MDLPGDLALPLERGAPWWYWTGGRPAIDFVNTFRERWWRRVETLVTDDDLAEWLVAARLLDAPPRIERGQLLRARELREHIDAGMRAAIEDRPYRRRRASRSPASCRSPSGRTSSSATATAR